MNTAAGAVARASMMIFCALVSLGVMVTPALAGGDSLSINTGSGWSSQPHTPLFDFVGMGPGWTGTARIDVRNDTDTAASLTLTSSDIVDDENGCNRPESTVDSTCVGDNAGELGREMVFAVYRQPKGSGALWRGSIYALERGVVLATSIAPHQVDEFTISAVLPYTTGNETQTDRLAFGLDINMSGDTVSVEGTKITRSTGGGLLHRVLGELPVTGTPAERLVAGALWLLLLGSAVTLFARRRTAPGVS